MDNKLKDILTNLHSDIEQEKLLEYISGQLSNKQMHEVEDALLSDEFASDAIEGLAHLDNKAKAGLIVNQLNTRLHAQLKDKRKKRKTAIISDNIVLIAILLILMLAVIAYIVIKKSGS